MSLRAITQYPTILLGLLFGISSCAPSAEETLQSFFSGRVELVTATPGKPHTPKMLQTHKSVVFRWQPRSHQSLTTMPEAFVVSLPAGSQSGSVIPAKVEQEGAYLKITVPPGSAWSHSGQVANLGVALGLGNAPQAKALLTTQRLQHRPSQGKLMTCDTVLDGWRLCWVDGEVKLAK